jgi:hypothetical protein
MPCVSQSQLAWGEGDSAASRVVLRSAGHIRPLLNSECRQVLEVGVAISQRSDIRDHGPSGKWAASRNPTRDAAQPSLPPRPIRTVPYQAWGEGWGEGRDPRSSILDPRSSVENAEADLFIPSPGSGSSPRGFQPPSNGTNQAGRLIRILRPRSPPPESPDLQ